MTHAERVLQVLIHDARTPIGVAQGYLRLLQEQRLETVEDRDRALARTMTALGRLARLCDEASALLNEGSAAPPAAMAAAALAAAVAARARESRFAIDRRALDIDPETRVRVAGGVDPLADAIAVVLATVVQPARDAAPALQVEIRDSELHFIGTPPGSASAPIESGPRVPFDPWGMGGLTVPLACQTIDRAAGRVWSVRESVIVAFPLEANRT